ncbi:MAG TPA: hypothetical protein EYN66_14555 [Myxococcales bacterium]|nr:hypothetical protein [Myxococcales bacterium]
MPTIAVDIMNGNAAPQAAIEAGAWISRNTSIQVKLVGPANIATPLLRHASYNPEQLVLQDMRMPWFQPRIRRRCWSNVIVIFTLSPG